MFSHSFQLKKFIKGLFIVVIMSLMIGCSGDTVVKEVADGGGASETGNPSPSIISGYAQKGPAGDGTEIMIFLLNNNFTQSGSVYIVDTDEFGWYEVGSVMTNKRYAQLRAEGYYYDEISGSLSASGQLNLDGLADIRRTDRINVNILTTLAQDRIMDLMDSGLSFEDAREQARVEVLNIFGIVDSSATRFEDMNMLEDGDANGILMAISAIMMQMAHDTASGGAITAELTSIIFNISNDIETDGVLDNATYITMIENAKMTVDVSLVRTNMETDYSSYVIPPFEQYIIGDLNVQWPDFNCTGNGISSVEVTASDVLTGSTSAGPWSCDYLEGTVIGLNEGTYDTVTVDFIDSLDVVRFSVEKTDVSITAGQTTVLTVASGDFSTGSLSTQWLIDCPSSQVSLIDVFLYDDFNNLVASTATPQDCTDGMWSAGNISPITNGRVEIVFMDAGSNQLCRSDISGVDILNGLTTVIGPFDLIPPNISAPSDGDSFVQGDTITFRGTGFDNQGDPLGISSLSWSSDVDGSLGTGDLISTSALSPGLNTITLTAADTVLGDITTTISLNIGRIIYAGSGEAYTGIQAAVDAASTGDVIIVRDGTYTENVTIDKPITVMSENGYASCNVAASNGFLFCFYITSDNVTLDGFTIYGSSLGGIRLNNADYCTIVNNRIGYDASHSNNNGISLNTSHYNLINGNICNSNSGHGIYMGVASNNFVLNNTCNSNNNGIYIDIGVAGNRIAGNTVSSNSSRGISLTTMGSGSSIDNYFFLNNLDNTINVAPNTSGANNWFSPEQISYMYGGSTYTGFLGNYYNDHVLTDSNGDGITDNPYDIPQSDPDDSYPLAMTSDNYTGSFDLVIDFGVHGLWQYDGITFSKLDVRRMYDACEFDNKLAIDLGTANGGLWLYDGVSIYDPAPAGSWSPDNMKAWGSSQLVIDFGVNGIYTYDSTNGFVFISCTTPCTPWDPEDIEPFGSFVAIDYGTARGGLYLYDGVSIYDPFPTGSWSPENMETWGSDLVVDFGSNGIYLYDGATMSQIDTRDPEDMEGVAGFLAVDFGTDGLWEYDGSAFSQVGPSNPENLGEWNGSLLIDYGIEGPYVYDGTSITNIGSLNAENIKGTPDFLAIDFGADGLWLYDGTLLVPFINWNPAIMDSVDFD